MNIRARQQRGFSAIIAVVLIVVFALMGAYMATLVGTQSITGVLSAGGMQGWFAARAGVELAAHSVATGGGCINGAVTPPDTGFSVNLTCSSVSVVENPPPDYNVYHIQARAERGDSGDIAYVSRTVRASLTDAP